MKETDNFYLQQEEPIKGVLLALRDIILSQDEQIVHTLKYGMPFFCYRGKMFCYLWFHKKHKKPYLGIVEGNCFDEPFLIQEDRSRMKIMLLDPNEDLPLQALRSILNKAVNLCRTAEARKPRVKSLRTE